MAQDDCEEGDAFIKYSVKEKLDSIEKKLDTHLAKESEQDEKITKNSTSISYLKGYCILIAGVILTGVFKIWLFP